MSARDGNDTAGEIAAALRAHANANFVTEVRVAEDECSEPLTLHCSSCTDAGAVAVSLVVSDCVTGVFKLTLKDKELTDTRQSAGMENFSWDSFLDLFFAALRTERGCSCTAGKTAYGASRMFLTLHFGLHAATLSSRLELLAAPAAPGFELETRPYLEEIQKFYRSALKVVRTQKSLPQNDRSYNSVSQPSHSMDLIPPGSSSLTQASGSLNPDLSERSRTPNQLAAPAAAPRSTAAAPARKRQGALLVAPGVTKPKCSNPFRLGA